MILQETIIKYMSQDPKTLIKEIKLHDLYTQYLPFHSFFSQAVSNLFSFSFQRFKFFL